MRRVCDGQLRKVSPAACEHVLTLAVESRVVKPENLQSRAGKNPGIDTGRRPDGIRRRARATHPALGAVRPTFT
jgi:hypothetical protein